MSEVEQWVLEMNQLAASVTVLRRRGDRIWRRTMRGGEPLSRDEIKAMRRSLARIQKATAP